MRYVAISVSCLLALANVACGQDEHCRNAERSDAASAVAWVSHTFIPQRASTFILVVTLPPGTRLPPTVDVGSAGRWWRAPLRLEDDAVGPAVSARTASDAPGWLKQADSVDVCLVLRRPGSERLIRLPRVGLAQVS